MQLFTYNEIQELEQLKDGSDIKVLQLPEYLFTWSPEKEYVNLWVTNNVGVRSMAPEYSFYQFVKALELAESDREISKVHALIAMFGLQLFEAKQNNTLPTEFIFKV